MKKNLMTLVPILLFLFIGLSFSSLFNFDEIVKAEVNSVETPQRPMDFGENSSKMVVEEPTNFSKTYMVVQYVSGFLFGFGIIVGGPVIIGSIIWLIIAKKTKKRTKVPKVILLSAFSLLVLPLIAIVILKIIAEVVGV